MTNEYAGSGIFERASALKKAKTPFIFCTIAIKEGSSPREAGAHMLVTEDALYGSIGGGNAESIAISRAREILAKDAQDHDLLTLDLAGPGEGSGEDSIDAGMICGGTTRILLVRDRCIPDALPDQALQYINSDRRAFFVIDLRGSKPLCAVLEPSELPEELSAVSETVCFVNGIYAEPVGNAGIVFIFGAGHVARALCPLLKSTGFYVCIADDRKDCVTETFFPDADELVCVSWDEMDALVRIGKEDYTVVATKDHMNDLKALQIILGKAPRYIACIGSRTKSAAVKNKLLQSGFPAEAVERIHLPAGLPIGGKSPAEIAVSITAQIIQEKYNSNRV